MSASITVDEWQREIERVFATKNGEGMTTRELALQMNVSVRTMGDRVRALSAQGRILVDYRWEPGVLPGRMKKVPVYRIKKR